MPEESLVDRINARAIDLAKRLEELLVEYVKDIQDPDGQVPVDTASAVVVALITHANCYTRAMRDRGATEIHMEALTKLASFLADDIYEAYEHRQRGTLKVKGPETAQ